MVVNSGSLPGIVLVAWSVPWGLWWKMKYHPMMQFLNWLYQMQRIPTDQKINQVLQSYQAYFELL